jgi:hypothetical protein
MCNERFEHIRRDQLPWLNELLIRAAEAANVPEAEIAKQLFDQRVVDEELGAEGSADADAGEAADDGHASALDQDDVLTNGTNSNSETG